MASAVKEKFKSAQKKVKRYLKNYSIDLKKCKLIVDKELQLESSIKKGYPDLIIVNRENIAESILAYQLVNVAQKKVITPGNVKYLYKLISEGLADYITNELYYNYDINNVLGYELIKKLVSEEKRKDVIPELIRLNLIKVRDSDVDKLMESEKVHDYFKNLIRPRREMIKRALQVTDELDLERPDYLPFGEEFKAWIFISKPRFNLGWPQIKKLLEKFYKKG